MTATGEDTVTGSLRELREARAKLYDVRALLQGTNAFADGPNGRTVALENALRTVDDEIERGLRSWTPCDGCGEPGIAASFDLDMGTGGPEGVDLCSSCAGVV